MLKIRQKQSDCFVPGLASANSDGVFDGIDKNLAVADSA